MFIGPVIRIEQVGTAVKRLTCILEVNEGSVIWTGPHGIPQSLQANAGMIHFSPTLSLPYVTIVST
jgi:hypothetical protein